MDEMRISGKENGSIGLKTIREKKLAEFTCKNWNILVRVFKNIVVKIAKIFLPKD